MKFLSNLMFPSLGKVFRVQGDQVVREFSAEDLEMASMDVEVVCRTTEQKMAI
jgi:hypothetical protein